MLTTKMMTWIGGALLAVAIPAVGATAHHHHLKTATRKPTALVTTAHKTTKTAVKPAANTAKPLMHKHHAVHKLATKTKPATKLTSHSKPATKLTTGVTSMHSGHSNPMN